MSLLNQFSTDLQALPELLAENTRAAMLKLEERLELPEQLFADQPALAGVFVRVISASPFVLDSFLKRPDLLTDVAFFAALQSPTQREHYAKDLNAAAIADEAMLMQFLRRFRRREMVRIAWRDLAGWADLDETLMDLSLLAEHCIQFALAFVYQQQCAKKGTPLLKDGTSFNLVVLGMGKLGAYELNYSSDIDLIFAFAEHGELADREGTSYSEFFERIVRSLVKILDAQTEDGFVFRTDIRLRPFGDSGPILMSFDGMENYYQTQAREWERYAMVKVRQVAGDFTTGAQLMAMFKPFVYRRYLDYGAIEELRSLKAKITQELLRKDRMENIKLGPGGIREIEFIGQAFQLIRGGQEKSLQQRGILGVLQTLEDLKLLSQVDAQQLRTSYRFLRRVENHIQAYEDQQTHDLPKGALAQAVLAYSMGYPEWLSFKADLDQVRQQVHAVFDQVFALTKQEQQAAQRTLLAAGGDADEALLTYLQELGFHSPETALIELGHFKKAATIRQLTAKGAGVMERLLPQLLAAIRFVENKEVTLKRLLNLFAAVAGRNVYLSLLEENPAALKQLVTLSAASPWISEYLARYPALFDELLDTRTLYEPLDRAALAERLQFQLQGCAGEDIEQYMIALRKFKQINVLRVAAADIMGVIPLMVVSDYLTYIAEVLLSSVLDYVWAALVNKHGLPPGITNEARHFGIIGYGKLGGLELSYGSDLDIVFIYDYADNFAMTDGAKPISAAQFFGRLGQQIRHVFDTRMLSGVLYETDLRLRPNGDSGLLVTHIDAYEQYLLNNAWTWEHQALVRARFMTGDVAIQAQFASVRQRVLTLPRDPQALKTEVSDMREKMRQTLMNKSKDVFDLKQSQGGMVDIEFMVQYAVLAFAAKHERLCDFTDNIRLLDGLQEIGVIDQFFGKILQTAYCAFRNLGHKQVLQGEAMVADEHEIENWRKQVTEIWQQLMV